MKIDVCKLADGQEITFSESWDPEELDLDVPGREYKSPIGVEAIAKRDSGIIKVNVVLKSELRETCSRCFKEFESPLKQVFNFVYSIDLSERTVALDDDIRAELILSSPQKILCSRDCLGLCIRCGADLNEEKCKCKEEIENA